TLKGSVIGTPQYMSPEQAAGQLDRLGPATDVYSLGAVLYCLLTGRAPFPKGNSGELLRQGQRGEFPPPRPVNPALPKALDAVCRKAMALRPEGRYATVLGLAAEVERWLADEPVAVYREPLAARAFRCGRRNIPIVAGLAAALLVGIAALGVG